jgi:hypothetical protein
MKNLRKLYKLAYLRKVMFEPKVQEFFKKLDKYDKSNIQQK